MVNKQHAALLTAFNLLSRLVPLGCGYALNLMSPGPSIIPMRPRLVRACKREFDAAAPRAQCPTHRLLRASTAHSSHSTKRPKRELLRFGHFKSRTFDAHSRRSSNYLKQSVEANGLTPEERVEARRLYDVIHGTWHLLACMTVTGLAVGLIEAYSFDLDAWSEESYVRFKPRVGVGIRCTHAPCCFPSRASPHSRPPPPLACARERVASCTGAQVWREVS